MRQCEDDEIKPIRDHLLGDPNYADENGVTGQFNTALCAPSIASTNARRSSTRKLGRLMIFDRRSVTPVGDIRTIPGSLALVVAGDGGLVEMR